MSIPYIQFPFSVRLRWWIIVCLQLGCQLQWFDHSVVAGPNTGCCNTADSSCSNYHCHIPVDCIPPLGCMCFDRILSNHLPIVADPNRSYFADSNYLGFDYLTNCPADPNRIAVILDNSH